MYDRPDADRPGMGGTPDSRPPVDTELSAGDARALIHRLPAITYVAEAGIGGAWHYVSPAAETMLGFSPERWLDDPGLWASRLHPEDRERVFAMEIEAIEGAVVAPIEYRLRHRDGRTVWVSDDALLVPDTHGRLRWHGVLSDITERKRAEEELSRRAAQQASVSRLGELALKGAAIEVLMDVAINAAAEILGVEWGAVFQLSADGQTLALRAGHGCSP